MIVYVAVVVAVGGGAAGGADGGAAGAVYFYNYELMFVFDYYSSSFIISYPVLVFTELRLSRTLG